MPEQEQAPMVRKDWEGRAPGRRRSNRSRILFDTRMYPQGPPQFCVRRRTSLGLNLSGLLSWKNSSDRRVV